ncbi:MAG: ATP-binding protein [Pseudomonadota bacterium]
MVEATNIPVAGGLDDGDKRAEHAPGPPASPRAAPVDVSASRLEDTPLSVIPNAAKAGRGRDFRFLLAAITTVLALLGLVGAAPPLALLLAWGLCAAAFFVRYTAVGAQDWSRPIERAVTEALSDRRSDQVHLAQLNEILNELPDPIMFLDRACRVDYANPAALAIVGRDADRKHVSAILRAPEVLAAIEEVMAGAPAHGVDYNPPGAVETSWRAYVRPIGQDRHGVILVLRDFTSERRLERMRVDFIANASHELRTPLSSLLGFIETLRGHAKEDPVARDKFLDIMLGQAQRMGRLIDDLLSLSRIELNEHVLPSATVDLASAAHDVVDGMTPIAHAQNVEIRIINDVRGGPEIIGDRDEVIQVVQNLVDNAIKYGGAGGRVEVFIGVGAPPALDPASIPSLVHHSGDYLNQVAARAGAELEDYLHLQVRDHGPGVERADLPRLTERFYRVDVQTSRQRGGTGLGLAIVKHIVNRHRGAFEAESAIGKGSAFTVSFRRRPVDDEEGGADFAAP